MKQSKELEKRYQATVAIEQYCWNAWKEATQKCLEAATAIAEENQPDPPIEQNVEV